VAYPTELVAKAHFELHVFERVAADTGRELLAEVIAWRARFPQYQHRPQDECIALTSDPASPAAPAPTI
jgi:hypothetical protein